MKKYLLAIFALAISAVAMSVYAGSDKKASIKFEETVYNFGVVAEDGGPVTHEFRFENVGNGNLVIKDAKAQCGCTRPEFPQKAIAPGKKGTIKVTYSPKGRPGSFTKKVTVVTNGSPSKTVITIKGNVVPK